MYLSAHSAWRWIVVAFLIPLLSRWQIWHWAWLEIFLNFNFWRQPELRKVLKKVDGEAHGWPRAKHSDWYTRNKSLYDLNNKTTTFGENGGKWAETTFLTKYTNKLKQHKKYKTTLLQFHPRSLEIDSAEVALWDQARQSQHLPPENCSLKLWQAFCDPPPLTPIVPLDWNASLLRHVANICKQWVNKFFFTTTFGISKQPLIHWLIGKNLVRQRFS